MLSATRRRGLSLDRALASTRGLWSRARISLELPYLCHHDRVYHKVTYRLATTHPNTAAGSVSDQFGTGDMPHAATAGLRNFADACGV